VSAPALIALALAMLASGLLCLDLLRIRAPGGMLQAGLGLASGLGLTVLILYVPLALGQRLDFRLALVALGLGTTVWLVRVALKWRRAPLRISPTAIAFALAGLALAKLSVAAPFSSYDDRAIWGLKGKALLVERGIDGAIFQDLDVVHYHRDYPLGLPLLMALCGHVGQLGQPEPDGAEPAEGAAEWVVRHGAVHAYAAFAVVWGLGIALLAFGSVVCAIQSRLARLAAVPLAVAPAVILPWIAGDSWSLAGADLPLCLFVGGAAAAVLHWRRGGSLQWLALAAFLAGCGVMLKHEAWIVIALLAVSALVSGPPRPKLADVALCATILALVAAAPLVVGTRIPHAPFEEDYLANLLAGSPQLWIERLPLLPLYAWQALSKAHMEFFWLVILIAAVPMCWRGGGADRILAVWVVLHTLCVAVVFLVTPDQLAWHVNTALPRLMGHMAIPAGLIGVRSAVLWLEALQSARHPARAPSLGLQEIG
jgi:hypothetical protein